MFGNKRQACWLLVTLVACLYVRSEASGYDMNDKFDNYDKTDNYDNYDNDYYAMERRNRRLRFLDFMESQKRPWNRPSEPLWEPEAEESDFDLHVRRLRRPTPSRAGWGHGYDFKGPCIKRGTKYAKGFTCDRQAGKYSFYGCSDKTCQWCTKNTWALDRLSSELRSSINC